MAASLGLARDAEVTHGDKGERMSMRAVIVSIILLVLLRDASADTLIIGTPGQIGAARFGANVGGALAAGVDYARLKAKLNAQIGTARRRFFAEYPKGRDFAQAEQEFAELLWSKDVYFMAWRLSTGSTPSMVGKLDAATGGTVDNGIPRGAGLAFNRWVSGIRDSLGATAFPSESQLLAALEANKDAYARYREARDLAEFEMQCRARPGPYCALPGGYSHGGATERAARIAEYYLAHYARTLSGGDAVKTKLRDAIIKYESLAYTTPDCIRHVGRIFENDPHHDKNLAALRQGIAKYESAKVMSPEDICIWAAQDMELAEHARNGTPQVSPRPNDFWDTLFRNSKFNELYGLLTSDQMREMRERRQVASDRVREIRERRQAAGAGPSTPSSARGPGPSRVNSGGSSKTAVRPRPSARRSGRTTMRGPSRSSTTTPGVQRRVRPMSPDTRSCVSKLPVGRRGFQPPGLLPKLRCGRSVTSGPPRLRRRRRREPMPCI